MSAETEAGINGTGNGRIIINVTDTTELSPTAERPDTLMLTPPNGNWSKRPSLPLSTLRVEQLREEGCSSPGSSTYNSEDSEFSDTDIINRLGEFVPPSEELCQKIADQMDFYFSDTNILKDSFLLKHVRRNKEGYVNLKLITSFKKMKTLTRDYRVVAYSLRKLSKILEVNADGNKAKRRESLPDYDETKSSRTVVAVNLPVDENANMNDVAAVFKDCGEIVMLQIHKPGKSIPSDVRKYLSQHPELSNKLCAVIEFEKHANAVKAVGMAVDGDDWSTGLRVVMLAASKSQQGDDSESESEKKQKKRNKKKTQRSAVINKEHEGFSSGSEGDIKMPRPRSRNSSFGSENSLPSRGGYTRALLSPTAHSDKQFITPPVSNQRRRSMPLPQSPLVESPKTTPKASPKASPKPSPKSSPRASPEMRRRANSGSQNNIPSDQAISSAGNSPWVQRRIQASREMSPLAKSINGRRVENLIRTPRGPEPGRGFYGGKGRGQPIIIIES